MFLWALEISFPVPSAITQLFVDQMKWEEKQTATVLKAEKETNVVASTETSPVAKHTENKMKIDINANEFCDEQSDSDEEGEKGIPSSSFTYAKFLRSVEDASMTEATEWVKNEAEVKIGLVVEYANEMEMKQP